MSAKARSVTVEAATRARWAAAQEEFELGLLLGQLSRSGSDAVLAAAPVPPEAESGVSSSFEDVSVEWVHDCAQQVDRMLPGGVSIVGLYVRTSSLPASAVFEKAAFYLRELVTGTTNASSPTVHYVVHVSGREPPAFKSFANVGNAAKATSAAAELVDVPGGIALKRYHTLVGVSEGALFSPSAAGDAAEATADKLVTELMTALEPFMNRVRRAVCVPDGETTDSQFMKLLAPAQAAIEGVDSNSLVGRVQGSIQAVAYVCSTEVDPTKAATEYLKSDLLKTLKLRIELAREKWIDDADESGQSSFELTGRDCLPKRNAIVWNYSSPSSAPGLFDLTVYTFPDDDEAQVAENALEILGGLAVKAEGSTAKSLEGSWTVVEQDVRARDEKILAARKGDPDFAPMPYHYVLLCIPVAIALVFLLVQQGLAVQRDLKGYDDE